MSKQTYKVVVEEATTREFEVDEANTPEEAMAIVEAWMDDGEEGALICRDIIEIDAYPTNNQEGIN